MGPIDHGTLIHLIDDAALEPSLWPDTLERVAHFVGATTSLFKEFNPRSLEVRFLATTELDSRYLQPQSFANPWMAEATTRRACSVFTTDSLVPLAELERTMFYADVVDPAQIHHGVGACLPPQDGWLTHVVWYRPRRLGAFSNADVRQLELLVPHFARAADTCRRFANIDMQRAAAFEALEVLGSAVIVVDSQLRILFVNACARAITSRGDGLASRKGVLEAATATATRSLQACVASAASAGVGNGVGAGGTVQLPRPSGAPPLHVTVAPLRMHGLALGARRAAAALFISNSDLGDASHQADHLTRICGLTAAESRVAVLIAEGANPQDVARSLGVSVNTVRTHLHRAFDKTGTTRQAQLARFVQRVCGGL